MHQRFCIYLADNLESQQLHHHLRYKVYCERKGFESAVAGDKFPQEKDDYDAAAARFVVKDNMLDSWIGTARVIHNRVNPLPSQHLGALDDFHTRLLGSHPTAEVSRLATLCCYAKSQWRSQLLQSIIIGTLGHSYANDIEWIVFLVSPGLARMLDRLGVPMQACGPEISHRGQRRAYCSNVKSGLERTAWAHSILEGSTGYESYAIEEAAERVRAA